MGQSLRVSLSAIVAIATLLWSPDASADRSYSEGDGYARGYEGGDPSTPLPDDPSEDELPRVRGAELRRDVRDIVVAPWPPPPRFTFGFGAHMPFQLIGGGLEVEGYPTSWLRLSAVYYAGMTYARNDPIFSNYAEALVGLRLLFSESERSVDVRVDDAKGKARGPFGSVAPDRRLVLRAWLPSYHALLVEVGVLTGLAVHFDCGAGCPPDVDPLTLPLDERQLVYLLAGLRYVYFVHVSSARQPGINRRLLFHVALHAIAPPWGTTEKVLLWRDGDRVERVPLGGRLVLRIPFRLSKPGAIQLAAGYLPMPATVLFSVGAEF